MSHISTPANEAQIATNRLGWVLHHTANAAIVAFEIMGDIDDGRINDAERRIEAARHHYRMAAQTADEVYRAWQAARAYHPTDAAADACEDTQAAHARYERADHLARTAQTAYQTANANVILYRRSQQH